MDLNPRDSYRSAMAPGRFRRIVLLRIVQAGATITSVSQEPEGTERNRKAPVGPSSSAKPSRRRPSQRKPPSLGRLRPTTLPHLRCRTALVRFLPSRQHDGMTPRPTRAFVVSVADFLAAAVLIVLGLWLALIDSFFVMRGRPPTGIATILGAAALATGSLVILVGKKVVSHDRFAIGCAIGAGFVTSALAASVGAWVIGIPALVVLISSCNLRNGRTSAARRSARSDRSLPRPATRLDARPRTTPAGGR